MKPLLISDANILIDLEDGDLITTLFKLPFQFQVPDMLFVDELEETHGYLLDCGLQLGELSPESMAEVEQLTQRYNQPSRYDCMALSLAKQQQCPLLTGDRALRKAAEQELVEVKGTIWIVAQLLENSIIKPHKARHAYANMKQKGRRLPWEIAEQQIKDYEASL